jgi:hypothetical protein
MDPPDGGGVVAAAEDGGEGRHAWYGESELGNVTSELEVVDQEVAAGVGGGDQAGGFTRRPGVSPEIWSTIGACKHAPHALARGVVGTGPRGEVRDNLPNVCRARSKRGQQRTPVIELVVNGTIQPRSFFFVVQSALPSRSFLMELGVPMAIVSVIGAEEEVKAMEDVPSRQAELAGCALSESQEIVNKDVTVGQGSSRRARDWPRDVWCGGRRTGELLQRVGGSEVGESPGVADEVGYRFGGSTEEWGRLYEAIGKER